MTHIIADIETPYLLVGGTAGMLAFITTMVQVLSSARIWKGLVAEIRTELKDCREGRQEQTKAHAEERERWRSEKATLETKCDALEGEVVRLRTEVHTDRWLGTDPESRRQARGGGT